MTITSQNLNQNTNNTTTNKQNTRDIGYFDYNPDLPPVETKDGRNIYHNIFSFTARLRIKAVTIDAAVMRQNLDKCFLGAADTWYTYKLSYLSRLGLQNDPDGVKEWYNALETRFRNSPGKSLSVLESVRYSTKEVRARKDPVDFIITIILNGQNSGIATTDAA